MTTGRLLIFTGDGKGKTTAALGMVLRAAGHGMRVRVLQFVKSDASVGEFAALSALPGVEITQTGRGFVPDTGCAGFEAHRAAARDGLSLAREALEPGRYNLLVLDEICTALSRGLLETEAVVELLAARPAGTHVALTGRGAPEALVALADTVTEMRCVKHGYEIGIPATKGVEF